MPTPDSPICFDWSHPIPIRRHHTRTSRPPMSEGLYFTRSGMARSSRARSASEWPTEVEEKSHSLALRASVRIDRVQYDKARCVLSTTIRPYRYRVVLWPSLAASRRNRRPPTPVMKTVGVNTTAIGRSIEFPPIVALIDHRKERLSAKLV